MTILLSVKPEYSERIFSGEKKYEFRKKTPKEHFKKAFIYESTPTKHIVGWIWIRKILSGHPKEIWEKCNNHGGIEEEKFFSYCADKKVVHALEIEKYLQFDIPIDPFDLCSDFKPPQNFKYFRDSIISDSSESKSGMIECVTID